MPAVAVSSALCDSARKLTTTIGPTMSSADVFGDAPREAARFFDAPQEIEAVLHFLDGAQQGPEQQRETQRADQAGADAVGDLHDLLRELPGASRPWA